MIFKRKNGEAAALAQLEPYQRIGNWTVVISYAASGLLALGGLIAIAKLL
jgi:hypothetical protein